MTMQIVINPGSGPVADATLAHAEKNIKHFLADCDLPLLKILRMPEDDERGRFGFMLYDYTGHITACSVQMPGIALERVRYTGEPGQDPWDYPRLYVNYSSWLWKFAVNGVAHVFGDDEEPE